MMSCPENGGINDYAISIEHEDSLMKNSEGLEKACRFLQEVIIREPMGEMWWA